MLNTMPAPERYAAVATPPPRPPAGTVLGVPLAQIDYERTLDWIDAAVEARSREYICVAAVHTVMACREDPALRQAVMGASFTVPDGQPLVWALRMLGHDISNRVYGPELMDRACSRAARTGQRFYLYGGRNPGALVELTRMLRMRHPGLRIVGGYAPPFRELSEGEYDAIAGDIKRSRADVVWVGVGVPKQEKWMARMRDQLEAPVLDRCRRRLRLPRRARPAGAARDAALRAGVALPAVSRTSSPLEALRALQPALRMGIRSRTGGAPAHRMRRGGICAAVGVMTLALAGSARADVYDDNPAAASRGFGDMHVYARAADGSTLERHLVGDSWTNWSSLGGIATSGPAAAAYGASVHVFAAGSDGGIYQNTLTDGKYSGWTSLGGGASSAPSAVWRRGPQKYFDVAVKGTDNAIWLRTWIPGTGWSAWTSLGGNLTSAPALNSQADGVLNVFARGTDCQLYQRAWNGAAWSDWIALGGCLVGAPTVVSRGPNQVDVYARGVNSSIYQRHWDAVSGWTAWAQVDPTVVASSAAVASDTEGREVLFARNGTGMVAKTWNASTSWTGWTDFGPVAVPAPPAAPASPPAAAPDGELGLEAGLRCTPAGGRLRVKVAVRKPKGKTSHVCRGSSST